jgi:hypothetical protein
MRCISRTSKPSRVSASLESPGDPDWGDRGELYTLHGLLVWHVTRRLLECAQWRDSHAEKVISQSAKSTEFAQDVPQRTRRSVR